MKDSITSAIEFSEQFSKEFQEKLDGLDVSELKTLAPREWASNVEKELRSSDLTITKVSKCFVELRKAMKDFLAGTLKKAKVVMSPSELAKTDIAVSCDVLQAELAAGEDGAGGGTRFAGKVLCFHGVLPGVIDGASLYFIEGVGGFEADLIFKLGASMRK